MGKVIVEQIVTADGYAADKDGGLGFFEAAGNFSDAEPEQMRMIASVGAIVLGANTYRMFADYWPTADARVERIAGPINTLPKYVVSSTLQSAPWGDQGQVEILRAGQVDALRLRLVPILIGAGRSFTPDDLGDRKLSLDRIESFPSGHAVMSYSA